MDARPNVLNKILPCYKRINLCFQTSGGEGSLLYGIYGRQLDDSSDEYSAFTIVVPHNIKTGSSALIIIDGAPWVTNNTGEDKKVRIVPQYNCARNGVLLGAMTTGAAVLITVPNNEVRYTIHKTGVLAIPDLQAADVLGIKLTRDADHADDTYVGDWWLSNSGMLQYIIDKIGIIT